MKNFLNMILLLLLGVNFCAAQNKPVVISQRMFDGSFGGVPLGRLNGWFFRPGNDTAWVQTDINMAGWQKLQPATLSAKNADKNGRVEGWFRIKIKLDDNVKVKGLNIRLVSYAPVDIYVNGKRLGSFGNTGLYGHPYAEYDGNFLDPGLALNAKPGQQFTLVLHVVDTLAPLIPGKLKSEWTNSSDFIFLYGADSEATGVAAFVNLSKNFAIWLWVSLTLCLLFWLLAVQNRKETVFFYIAGCSTFFVSLIYCQLLNFDIKRPDCLADVIFFIGTDISLILFLVSLPVIIAKVFKRRLSLWLKIGLIAFITCTIVCIFSARIPDWIGDSLLLFPITVSIYYLISSWKKLKGAQWSIVAGLLAPVIFLVTISVTNIVFPGHIYINKGVGYFLYTGFIFSFPVSLLVYVSMRFKEIINEVRQNAAEVVRLSDEKKEEALHRQKVLEEEVNRQTAEIRANQARLIQAEKMASLGELTAGIAHEIQNPLNFVNNFSEVNKEMVAELEEELKNGNIEDALAIAADIKQNEEKINHHGKRADFIVKGMLLHSRNTSGEKELTNINVMANEFFKLSYHGLRAKDKNFNAEMVTDFAKDLPLVNIAHQDIGRVLLNLFNNAFYAVNQKQKTAGADYKPEVSVSTSIEKNNLVIRVKDNGNGIPDAIKGKIMQPFFTTKPTGEGTGLGLSLSYDIVVKGHAGNISVDSKEGEFTELSLILPLIK